VKQLGRHPTAPFVHEYVVPTREHQLAVIANHVEHGATSVPLRPGGLPVRRVNLRSMAKSGYGKFQSI